MDLVKIYEFIDKIHDIASVDVEDKGDRFIIFCMDSIETNFGDYIWQIVLYKDHEEMKIQLVDFREKKIVGEKSFHNFLNKSKDELSELIDRNVENMLVLERDRKKGIQGSTI
ncbi:MAG: hypothetical protein ACTSR0_07510 [Candidatus Asgardarchaeia archaeon]